MTLVRGNFVMALRSVHIPDSFSGEEEKTPWRARGSRIFLRSVSEARYILGRAGSTMPVRDSLSDSKYTLSYS